MAVTAILFVIMAPVPFRHISRCFTNLCDAARIRLHPGAGGASRTDRAGHDRELASGFAYLGFEGCFVIGAAARHGWHC